MSTLNPMIHPTRCEHGRHWTGGCPDCEREIQSNDHLPFDPVREFRKRAEDAMKMSGISTGPNAIYYRAMSYTYTRCADELESNPTWKEAMNAHENSDRV